MFYLEIKSHAMARRVSVAAVSAALAMLAGTAHADDWADMFSVSGFGTVGTVHSSSTGANFVATKFQPTGPGIGGVWSETPDTKMGFQLNGKFTDKLTGVLQIVAQDQTNGTFSPRIEWANLQYAITPDLSARVGRIALPTLMESDTRMVGYSNPWIRPPIETYISTFITNSDGGDATYRMHFGNVNDSVQFAAGNMSVDTVGATGAVSSGNLVHQIKSLSDSFEWGALTARAGVTTAEFTSHGLTGTTHSHNQVVNLGAIYDPGKWFVQGEITQVSLGVIPHITQADYVTAGYRLWNFTPYVTYSKVGPRGATTASIDQKSTSVGVRWDFMKNVDLKVQLDHAIDAPGSAGYYLDSNKAFLGTGSKVVSVAVDYIF